MRPKKSRFLRSLLPRLSAALFVCGFARGLAAGEPCEEALTDGGLEDSLQVPGLHWNAASTQFGTPICSLPVCGDGEETVGPRTGTAWVWFGGLLDPQAVEVALISQTVVLPLGTAELNFHLWIGRTDNNRIDDLRVTVDDELVHAIYADDAGYKSGYAPVMVNLTDYADGLPHKISLVGRMQGAATSMSVDDISLITCAGGATPTPTPSPSDTPPPTPSASPTNSPAPTATPSPSPTEPASPTPSGTPTPSPTPGGGRAVGDFDNSGCTDLADFLTMLDNWQLEFEGETVGLTDFLALLDNWNLGPDC